MPPRKRPPSVPLGPVAERRGNQRTRVQLPVEYRRLNGLFADYTRSISKGGMFVRTEEPLPTKTELVFLLSAPQLAKPLELRGRVVWVRSRSKATRAAPAGMGIEFQFERGERAALQATIEQLMAEALGFSTAERILGKKPTR